MKITSLSAPPVTVGKRVCRDTVTASFHPFYTALLERFNKNCDRLFHGVALSLTPDSFSPLGEKEKYAPRFGKVTAEFSSATCKFYEPIQQLFPLPAGEGQGENSPKNSRFEPLNHPARSSVKTLRAFLLLLGEKAGMRASVTPSLGSWGGRMLVPDTAQFFLNCYKSQN